MIGTILGDRYELIEKIGEGGMAEVYKARCLLLNRYVAVKILKEEYTTNAEFMDKFRKEAAATASFSHNNIVNIFDVGVSGKYNYIVMELVNGKTLKQIICDRGSLPYQDVISIGIQIAKALECAHRNGVIHRDIKPHNILVTEDGTVKVTDFGIAKASNSDTITHTSKVIGSAHYFSPEQAKGKVVDFRTDIYSLGIVLYEMSTGKVPFDGDSPVSIALKHIQEPVVPPNVINFNIPLSLSNLILKAIEKEPIRRYQSASEILNDLRQIQNNINYTIIQNNSMNEEYTRVMEPINTDKKQERVVNKSEEKSFDDDFDDDDEFDDDDDVDDTIDKKKRNKIIITSVIIFALILGIFTTFAFSPFGSNNKNKNNEVKIPALLGKSENDAKTILQDLDLVLVVDGEEKSDKPKGTIIKSMPNEGTTVKKKSQVKVILSEGPEKVSVPDVRNISLGEAQDYIVSAGLKVGKITEEDNESYGEGIVIRQNPQPNTTVKKGDTVNIVVSKGAAVKLTKVPNLNGMTIDEATNVLNVSNLQLGQATPVITEDKKQDGKIFNQGIAAGSKVKEQSTINVNYYKYKEPEQEKVTVPDFINQTVADAKGLAASLGLNLNVSGNDSDIVNSQSIAAGTNVNKGETITITAVANNQENNQNNNENNNQNNNGNNNGNNEEHPSDDKKPNKEP